MELYKEILIKNTMEKAILNSLEAIEHNASDIVQSACYQAIAEIKAVLEDDSMDDKTCFWRIDEIIRVFDRLGSPCSRHDFG